MKIRLSVLAAVLLLVLSVPLFAERTAVLKEVTGKVQVKAPNADWASAEAGATLSQGTIISTGFKSTAVLDLGNSTIQIQQLTRMSLAELLEKGDTVSTTVFVTVGKVKASVDRVPGLTQAFKLQSPVSTAAVRGTEFTFAVNWVSTDQGVVEFLNANGIGREVAASESCQLAGLHLPAAPGDYRADQESVNPHAGPANLQSGNGSTTSAFGSLVVTVQ